MGWEKEMQKLIVILQKTIYREYYTHFFETAVA